MESRTHGHRTRNTGPRTSIQKEGPLDDVPTPRPRIVRIDASADARTQGGSEDVNFSTGFLWVDGPRSKGVFLHFDLSGFAPDAEIQSAHLRMNFTGTYEGTNEVEVGAVEGPWDPETITWANQPSVAWKGATETVTDAGEVSWNVLPAVQAWVAGDRPNHGLALRGLGSVLKAAHSTETSGDEAPNLLIVVLGAEGIPGPPPSSE